MPSVRSTMTVNAAPERVFAVFADIPNCAERVSGITRVEMLSEGPVGVGTRWRETRVFFKKEATEEMEIVEFEPGKSYVVGAESHGMKYRTEMRFARDGEGTRVDSVFEGTPISLFAKLMSPFAGLMIAPVKKSIEQDFQDLKAYIESQP